MGFLFRKNNLKNIFWVSLITFGTTFSFVLASNMPSLKLVINPGVLSVDVVDVDNNYTSIDSPVFNFNSVNASMECLTGDDAPVMVLGSNIMTDCDLECPNPDFCICSGNYVSGGNIYIFNPDAASDGFTVSLAAYDISNSFTDGVSSQISYNGDDCGVGASQTLRDYVNHGGRMYVNPEVATIFNGKCASSGCATTGLSLGSNSFFEYGVVDSITLVQADSSANNIADYVINGINVSQTIPAMTPAGDYTMKMVMSIIGNGNSEVGSILRSEIPITYNGINIEGSDIYVGNNDPVYLNSDSNSTEWSMINEGYYIALDISKPTLSSYSGQETVIYPGFGNTNVIITATIQSKEVPPVTSEIKIHFGTGKDCGAGMWVSNSAVCPGPVNSYLDRASCEDAGYSWYNNICSGVLNSYLDQSSCEAAGYNWNTWFSKCYQGDFCSIWGC